MTWTYDPTQAAARDQLRFIIGDTDVDRQLLSDEELTAVMARHTSNAIVDLNGSAIELADHLEAKFVRRAESRSGDIIADFLTVAGKYRDLANRLRKKKQKGSAIITIADRTTDQQNCIYPQPSIRRDEWDFPGIEE